MKVVKLETNFFIGNVLTLDNGFDVKVGDSVIIDFDGYLFLGQAISIENKDFNNDLKYKIVRKATAKDLKMALSNQKKSFEILYEVKKIGKKLKMEMNFVEAYYSFDRKRLYLSFISENRVDFRELAKRLAQKYHARIEFRQIGVRDKSKIIGGIGPCGLMLCCNRFLNDFESVSINMAKNQMLALNPSKVNGICGRLKCCLNYENDTYKKNRSELPKIGSLIETKDGVGKVIDIDILRKICRVELQNKMVVSVEIGDNDGKSR